MNLEKNTINHKNGIKTDNTVKNLEWATMQEQIDHAFDANLRKKEYTRDKYYHNLYSEETVRIICDNIVKDKSTAEIILIIQSSYPDKKRENLRSLINSIKNKEKWLSVSKEYVW